MGNLANDAAREEKAIEEWTNLVWTSLETAIAGTTNPDSNNNRLAYCVKCWINPLKTFTKLVKDTTEPQKRKASPQNVMKWMNRELNCDSGKDTISTCMPIISTALGACNDPMKAVHTMSMHCDIGVTGTPDKTKFAAFYAMIISTRWRDGITNDEWEMTWKNWQLGADYCSALLMQQVAANAGAGAAPDGGGGAAGGAAGGAPGAGA